MNDTVNPPISGPVFLIEVTQIKPNPNQPRRDFNEDQLRELANSIREFGVLQPIIVTKIERETPTGTEVEYLLIAGERRLMASKLAGLERIPAIIRNVSLDKERLELAIVENIQRVNLNPIESARAYSRLQDEFKLTQREIAARIGKSREVIANGMRLLSLPQVIQDAVAEGKLSESQARLLLMIEDIPKQQALFEEIIRNNLSVREVKSKIAILKNEAEKAMPQAGDMAPVDPETIALQRELEEALGAKVKVEKAGASGKITINFHSAEEMYGLVQRLKEKHGSIPQGFSL
jgi:ParB family chromosome partitioning protein